MFCNCDDDDEEEEEGGGGNFTKSIRQSTGKQTRVTASKALLQKSD